MLRHAQRSGDFVSLVSTTVHGEFNRQIPLGLLYLASALEKNGIKVELRDFQPVTPLPKTTKPYNTFDSILQLHLRTYF